MSGSTKVNSTSKFAVLDLASLKIDHAAKHARHGHPPHKEAKRDAQTLSCANKESGGLISGGGLTGGPFTRAKEVIMVTSEPTDQPSFKPTSMSNVSQKSIELFNGESVVHMTMSDPSLSAETSTKAAATAAMEPDFGLSPELKAAVANVFETFKKRQEAEEECFQNVAKILQDHFKDEWEFNDRYIYLSFEPGKNGRMYSRLSPHCEGRLLELKNKWCEGSDSGENKIKNSLRKCWLYAVKLFTVAVLDGRLLDSKAIYSTKTIYKLPVITGWNKSYLFPNKVKGKRTLNDIDEEFLNNFHYVEADDDFFNAFPRGVPGFAVLTIEEKAERDDDDIEEEEEDDERQ